VVVVAGVSGRVGLRSGQQLMQVEGHGQRSIPVAAVMPARAW
jgi:hypothetical protein